MALSDSPTVAKLATWIIAQLRGDEGSNNGDRQSEATRAQIERIASQHAVGAPAAAEIERIATSLRSTEAAATRRMIQ